MSSAAVVELRQYRLHPGRRDELIALFEAELLEPQEALGMAILGLFRDLDDPARFVWLRGFPDMERRAEALAAFYDGPVWRAHREAANATMADSDDVLLLRPAEGAPAPHRAGADAAFVVVAIAPRRAGEPPRAAIADAGGRLLAELVTEPAPNTFPRLPVREGEDVAVWIAACPDRDALDRVAALAGGAEVRRLAPAGDGRHDFDFLFGRWRVHNRRLAHPLSGSNEWREFETVAEVRPVLGGLGNVDSFTMAHPSPANGWQGMTLRLFDPAVRRWSIWWASTTAPGRLDPPMTGAFRDGLGEFFGDDVSDGRPIRLRFHWSAPAPGEARWEQAFSPDAGATWETNWIMSFRRER